MATNGATAIPLSSALLLTFATNRQSSMARPLCRTTTEFLTSRHYSPPCGGMMHLDGRDLRPQSLSVRRSMLNALIGSDEESAVQFSDEFDGDGDLLFNACVEHGLEGIMSKL